MLNRIKALFHDYWFETLILFCCLIYFGYCTYNITMGIAPKTEPRETSFPWNTQILLDSGEPPHTAEIIKRSDIRYGKRVRKTCLQDDRVLFVFASEPDRRVQLLVFNVFGEYRYGYWVYMENHVQAALSPCYEGILLFDYKKEMAIAVQFLYIPLMAIMRKNCLPIQMILVSLQKHISIALPIMK